MTSNDSLLARHRRRGQATSFMRLRFLSNRGNRDASKSGDRVSESGVRVPSPTEGLDPSKIEVFKAFAGWRLCENPDAWVGTMDDWNINPYEDAFVISPSGRRRSSRLHLTKGGKGVGFASSMMSMETAHRKFASGAGSHQHCES